MSNIPPTDASMTLARRIATTLWPNLDLGSTTLEEIAGKIAPLIDVASTGAIVRIDELETVCAESYQVVGTLSDMAGVFDDPQVIRALDNLSEHRLIHKDVLPFAFAQVPSDEIFRMADDWDHALQLAKGVPNAAVLVRLGNAMRDTLRRLASERPEN